MRHGIRCISILVIGLTVGCATAPPPTKHVLRRSDVIGLDPVLMAPARAPDDGDGTGRQYTEQDIVDLTLLNIVRKNKLVTKLKVFDLFFAEESRRKLSWWQRRNADDASKDWSKEDKDLYYSAAAIVIEAITEANHPLEFDSLLQPGREIVLPDPALF